MVLFSIIYFDNIFNYVHNHNDSDPVFNDSDPVNNNNFECKFIYYKNTMTNNLFCSSSDLKVKSVL